MFISLVYSLHVLRVGKHCTIVAHAIGVQTALLAAEELAGVGVECEVVNLRSIRPLVRVFLIL